MLLGREEAENAVSDEPRAIQSVARAAAILEIIAQEGGAARLQTIADHCELKKSTAHNILATLEQLGYVQRRPVDTKYYLGERIMNLARVVGDDGSLRARLRPALETLSARTGETVFLATPSGDQVLFIDGIEQPSDDQKSWIGARRPLGGSAMGLVFLAFMPTMYKRVLSVRPVPFSEEFKAEIEATRIKGFALDLQKQREGQHCVAVPIFEGGVVRAAFGLRAPSSHFKKDMLNDAAWIMMKLASKHQSDIGKARNHRDESH